MTNELKHKIMIEIENKAILFDKRSNIQYRIRCPFCGDSGKNPKDMHCYIKCDYSNPDEGIKYNCFLCNKGGTSITPLLKALNADSNIIKESSNGRYNTIGSIRSADVDIMMGDPIMNSPQIEFLENRLGLGLEYDDYKKFRIIWNMNEILRYVSSERIRNTMPNNLNRINFLSDNKALLLSRSFIEGSEESQWRKVKLFNVNSKSFYLIQTTLDLFTDDTITVNIAEGVLDIISAYKNFNDGPNSVFIAALGSDYMSALNYMIAKGFVGNNIDVKIYIDHKINERFLISELKKYKWIFGSIRVLKNIKYKDIGVRIENIKLKEDRIC